MPGFVHDAHSAPGDFLQEFVVAEIVNRVARDRIGLLRFLRGPRGRRLKTLAKLFINGFQLGQLQLGVGQDRKFHEVPCHRPGLTGVEAELEIEMHQLIRAAVLTEGSAGKYRAIEGRSPFFQAASNA